MLWTANIVCVWLSDWLSACTPPLSVCLIGWVSPQSKLCMRVNSAIKTVIRISWIILFLLQSVVLLPRDAMLARYMPSLCLRLSVTSRYCVKTTKHRITQATLHDSPRSLVFWCQRSPRNSTGVNSYGHKRNFRRVREVRVPPLSEVCTVHLGQLSLASLRGRLIEYQLRLG